MAQFAVKALLVQNKRYICLPKWTVSIKFFQEKKGQKNVLKCTSSEFLYGQPCECYFANTSDRTKKLLV